MVRENEQKAIRIRTHTVSIEDRSRISITDVEDVESFNESEVMLMTGQGIMIVSGSGLHISRLNLDEGQLVIDGSLLSLEYDSQSSQSSGGGLFSRMFK